MRETKGKKGKREKAGRRLAPTEWEGREKAAHCFNSEGFIIEIRFWRNPLTQNLIKISRFNPFNFHILLLYILIIIFHLFPVTILIFIIVPALPLLLCLLASRIRLTPELLKNEKYGKLNEEKLIFFKNGKSRIARQTNLRSTRDSTENPAEWKRIEKYNY